MKNYYSNNREFYDMAEGTRYQRPVVGNDSTIKNITLNDIRNYYNKWYHPKNQVIIITGDLNTKEMTAMVKNTFSDINRTGAEIPKYEYTPKPHAEPRVLIYRSPNQKSASIKFLYSMAYDSICQHKRSAAYYFDRTIISKNLELLVDRLNRGNTDALLENIDYYNIENTKEDNISAITASIAPGCWQQGLLRIAQTMERVKRYGFTKKEYSGPTSQIYTSLLDYSLGSCYIDPENLGSFLDQYSYVDGESVEIPDNKYARYRKMDNDSALTIILTFPEDASIEIPTADIVLKTYHEARNANLDDSKFAYASAPNYLRMMRDLQVGDIKPGHVVDKKKIGIGRCKEYTLSNGAKVILKKTKFMYDCKIDMIRNGIYTQFSDEDYPKINILPQVVSDMFENSNNYTIYTRLYAQSSINETYQGGLSLFRCQSQYELMLRQAYYRLTNTKIDSMKFNNLKFRLTSQAKNEASLPGNTMKLLNIFLSDDKYKTRYRELDSSEIAAITLDEIKELQQKLRGNYNGAKFLVQTPFKDKEILPDICKYIGGLPSTGKPISIVRRDAYKSKNHNDSIVYRYTSQEKPTAFVTVDYTLAENVIISPETILCARALNAIIGGVLANNIRFKEGGLYSVTTYSGYEDQTKEELFVGCRTTCNPAQSGYIQDKIVETIHDMAYGNLITENNVNGFVTKTLQEIKTKKHELSRLIDYHNQGSQGDGITASMVKKLTPGMLRKYVANILEHGYCYKFATIGE